MDQPTRIDTGYSHKNIHSFSLAERVRIELVENVYSQTTIGLFASIFCATILFYGLYKPGQSNLLIIWYTLLVLVMVLRLVLVNAFKKTSHTSNLDLWRNLFILGSTLAGLCWGIMSGILLPYGNIMEFTLTVLILSGITAGAVSALAGILSACIIYLALALLPLIIRLLIEGNHTFILFDATLLIYLFYLISLAIKSNHVAKDSISLKFENNELLAHLSNAKNELEQSNRQLEYSASHDILTGLYNRLEFEKHCERALKKAEVEQKILAFFYINVDKFKEVNDTYNYSVGSQLLTKMADRIKRLLPAETKAARFSNDEIVIVSECVADIPSALELGERIRHSMVTPFEVDNCTILATLSIGISLFPLDGRDFEALLRSGEKFMRLAKNAGGNQVQINSEPSVKPSLINLFSKKEYPQNQ